MKIQTSVRMSFTPLQPHWPLPLLHYFCNVPSIPEEPSSINRAWQRSGTDCANSQACCLKADGGESIPALFPKSLLPANRESSKQERGTGAQGCSHLGALLAAPGRVPCLQGVLSPWPCCSAGAGNKNTGCAGGSGFRGTAGKRRCSDSLREEKKSSAATSKNISMAYEWGKANPSEAAGAPRKAACTQPLAGQAQMDPRVGSTARSGEIQAPGSCKGRASSPTPSDKHYTFTTCFAKLFFFFFICISTR